VRLAPSTDGPRVSPNVAAGYGALRAGRLTEARQAYAAALATDPGSTDAMLGLATVEARSGNATAAAGLYRKALELDPRNPTALAGIASLSDFTRPDAVELQLRTDISRDPRSAALHVALGNLYASQGRWTEAQAAFFDAHRLEPGGADILYNLAVTLDRMGQARAAVPYYRRALEVAAGHPTPFDPAAVARRLAEIQP
jgi:Tfp pilus assembly protein PilF